MVLIMANTFSPRGSPINHALLIIDGGILEVNTKLYVAIGNDNKKQVGPMTNFFEIGPDGFVEEAPTSEVT
jgi:hypothetical protein